MTDGPEGEVVVFGGPMDALEGFEPLGWMEAGSFVVHLTPEGGAVVMPSQGDFHDIELSREADE